MFLMKRTIKKLLIACLMVFLTIPIFAQVDSGGNVSVKNHAKEVIGYITQWDAWKSTNAGLPAAGALTHLNIDYSQYTILNYSFFGVAVDGSLHSGDYRDKNIYKVGVVQQPADIFMTEMYSSWDLHILFGELEALQYIDQTVAARAQAQGFEVVVGGVTWSNPSWGIYDNPLPLPLKKTGGAPGLLELSKAMGVKVMASIGGWSMSKHFPEMAADPVKKARFIEDCKRLIALGFDGIDIDWEYPGDYGMNIADHSFADYKNFELLIADIRRAIGPAKLITAAMSADPRKLRGFDWVAISQNIDYYNMMTYDMGGGWSNKASHNAPVHRYTGAEVSFFSWDDTLAELKAQGVPTYKVNFGIPFYGRGVVCDGAADLNAPTLKKQMTVQPDGTVSSAMDLDNFLPYDGTPSYEYIRQKTGFGTTGGWTRHWDREAMVPYLTNGKYFLSYDDEESIAYKGQYIVSNQLAGAIIWTVYGDLEFSGTATSYGTKLKRWSTVRAPLINKLNASFGCFCNFPPEITAPKEVKVYLGSTVVIDATAIDRDGVVIEMKAMEGANLLAMSDNGALNVVWTPTAVGRYNVIVSAKDNSLRESSAEVVVTVVHGGPPPPTIEIISPVDNSEVVTKSSTATVEIEVRVTDIDGQLGVIELSGYDILPEIGGDLQMFTVPNVAIGTHTFEIIAVDVNGLTHRDRVTITVVASPSCKVPAWDKAKVYKGGELVCYNGRHWKAKWWTLGEEPGASQWGPWEDSGVCNSLY